MVRLNPETGLYVCPSCKEEKSVDGFHKKKSETTGLNNVCKLCAKAAREITRPPSTRVVMNDLERAVAKKDSDRRSKLNRKDKILIENARSNGKIAARRSQKIAEFLEAQNGVCAGCGTSEPGHMGWILDHDHSCHPYKTWCDNCARGALCFSCNVTLGHSKDNVETLMGLAAYLMQTQEINIGVK